MDTSDPQAPKIVHAFMPRDTRGYTIKETWDVLGMRATRSDDTVLEGAFVPDQYIARVVSAGAAGIDLFVLAIFAWAMPMFGNIYYAIAQRAFDWTIENVKKKTSLAMSRSMAYHAEVQHAVADMALELEAIGPHLDKIAQDWSDGVDHGHMWGAKLVAVKHRAVEGAWKVVDTAMDLAGGFGIFKQTGIERLFRDARLGRIHPANAFLTREFVAKTVLGISIDETTTLGLVDRGSTPPACGIAGQGGGRSTRGTLPVLLCLLHEHLWPQFAHLDDDIGRDVQPLCCLADGLGIRSLVQAVGLLLVGAQEREQPLDADIGIDLGDLQDVVPVHLQLLGKIALDQEQGHTISLCNSAPVSTLPYADMLRGAYQHGTAFQIQGIKLQEVRLGSGDKLRTIIVDTNRLV